jgi:hypothetical protein
MQAVVQAFKQTRLVLLQVVMQAMVQAFKQQAMVLLQVVMLMTHMEM